MLLSMTGFGEAHSHEDALSVSVEVRAVNNRFFKLSIRTSDGYGPLEPHIEEVVRQSIRRGTVQVSLRAHRLRSCESFQINAGVLGAYREQLQSSTGNGTWSDRCRSRPCSGCPGSLTKRRRASMRRPIGRQCGACLEAALENLARMRVEEGRAMTADLEANCRAISTGLDQIGRRAPLMLEAYRARLQDRLGKVLAEFDLAVDPTAVLKEVGLFAERADVSEELVRLRSHLDQFVSIMALPESSGRKFEFLTQEMFREANTIGSKANDVEIAKEVIEIKTAIERVREMIQNVE